MLPKVKCELTKRAECIRVINVGGGAPPRGLRKRVLRDVEGRRYKTNKSTLLLTYIFSFLFFFFHYEPKTDTDQPMIPLNLRMAHV